MSCYIPKRYRPRLFSRLAYWTVIFGACLIIIAWGILMIVEFSAIYHGN